MKATNVLFFAIAFLALYACAATQSADVDRGKLSPFLGEVKGMLSKGGKEEAQLIYRRSGANLAAYDQVILDPVRVIVSKDLELAKASQKD